MAGQKYVPFIPKNPPFLVTNVCKFKTLQLVPQSPSFAVSVITRVLPRSKVQILGVAGITGADDGLGVPAVAIGFGEAMGVGLGLDEGVGDCKGEDDGVNKTSISDTLMLGLIKNIRKIIRTPITKIDFIFTLHCSRIYSHMASWEEKRNIKRAITLLALSICVFIFLFYVGIPLVARFTAFLGNLRSSNMSANGIDTTPPAPPKFDNFPDFTNQNKLTLSGNAESGATIGLTFNNVKKETIVDKNGSFTFQLDLKEGKNSFMAEAVDASGNISKQTKTYEITFDDKAPELDIIKPTDGTNLFGSIQRQVTIEGKSEENSQVTVSDRFVAVDESGGFQFTTTLTEGENKFNIKSVDNAGNSTEKPLTLYFTP